MTANIKNTIYRDSTGYIKGYKRKDGYWWIEEFVINQRFRGKKLAKILANKLPKKCKLYPYPLFKFGNGLTQNQLIVFYTSIGFKNELDEYGNMIMKKD